MTLVSHVRTWLAYHQPFWPGRRWWLALAVILLLAGVLSVIGYDFSLPYAPNPAERSHVVGAGLVLTRGSARIINFDGYPPASPTIAYLLLRWLHNPSEPYATILGPMRLITVAFGLLGAAAIALLGYRAGSPLGGLIAAGLWSVLPEVIQYNHLALADIPVTAVSLAALFFTITSAIYDRDDWATGGVWLLILAILFKYSALAMAPVTLGLPLLRLLHPDADRRRVWINLVKNSVILGIALFWLVLIYPSLRLSSQVNMVRYYGGNTNLANVPASVVSNVVESISRLSPGWGWLIGLAGVALLLTWPPLRRKAGWLAMAAMAVVILGWYLAFSVFGTREVRQFFLPLALLTVGAGAGLAGLGEGLAHLIETRKVPDFLLGRPQMASAAVVILAAALTIPQMIGAVKVMRTSLLHDRRNDLASWADVTLGPSRVIGSGDNIFALDPLWGGYAGETKFELQTVRIEKLTRESLADYDAEYLLLTERDYQRLTTDASRRPVFDRLPLLKSYPESPDNLDPGIYVLSLTPVQRALEAQTGPIKLVGYSLSSDTVKAGGSITFRLFWKASARRRGL